MLEAIHKMQGFDVSTNANNANNDNNYNLYSNNDYDN